MKRNPSPRPWIPASVLLLALAAGCASAPEGAPDPAANTPERASITEEEVAEASVVSVDRAAREMTIERSDGARMVLTASPDFRNFEQVEPGMKVKARVAATLSVRRLAPDEAERPPTVTAQASRARLGEKPAGGVVAGLGMTVTIVTVDAANAVVTATDPDGVLRTVKARRGEGRTFISTLKPGDRVEIVYGEMVVLAME